MDFEYSTEIEKIFHKMLLSMNSLVGSIDNYRKEPYNEFDENGFMSDIQSEIASAEREITKHINTDIVDDVFYQLDDLNSLSDEGLMDAIKVDKGVFKYIMNPSDDVVNLYKFIYEL